MIMVLPEVQHRAVEIFNVLDRVYPGAGPTINFSNPFELLVASIIGARATDESVNRTTPHLFKKYPTPKEMASADYGTLMEEIHDVGLADVKAKYLIETSRMLLQLYGGQVPCTMEELTELPGVGRKIVSRQLPAWRLLTTFQYEQTSVFYLFRCYPSKREDFSQYAKSSIQHSSIALRTGWA
jgi:endonuclease III